MLGDFNLIPGSGEYAALSGGAGGFVDAWAALGHGVGEGWSCVTSKGHVRLDYAFVTLDLAANLRAISVDREAQGSDHQPIRIEIEL